MSAHLPGGQVAKALAHSLSRWHGLASFLDDCHLCMTNDAGKRALPGIAVGRYNWTFAGSDAGSRGATAIYIFIGTANRNDADPQGWLADVLARLGIIPPSASPNWCVSTARAN